MLKKRRFFDKLAYTGGPILPSNLKSGVVTSSEKKSEEKLEVDGDFDDSPLSEKKISLSVEDEELRHHPSFFFKDDSDYESEEEEEEGEEEGDRDTVVEKNSKINLKNSDESVFVHDTIVKLATTMFSNVFPHPDHTRYTRQLNQIFSLQKIQKHIKEREANTQKVNLSESVGKDSPENTSIFTNINETSVTPLVIERSSLNKNEHRSNVPSEPKIVKSNLTRKSILSFLHSPESESTQPDNTKYEEVDISSKIIFQIPRSKNLSQSSHFIIDEVSDYKTPQIVFDYVIYDLINTKYQNLDIEEDKISALLHHAYNKIDTLKISFDKYITDAEQNLIKPLKELRENMAALIIQRAFRNSQNYKICSHIRDGLFASSKKISYLRRFAERLKKTENRGSHPDIKKDHSNIISKLSPRNQESLVIQRVGEGIKKSPHISISYPTDINQNTYTSVKVSDYDGFRFKEYAPHIFSNLRRFWGIDHKEYQKELGSENIKILAQNAGRSGSYFLMSESKKYILKSMSQTEFRLLFNELLKDYANYMFVNKSSLLTRYLGMYLVKWYTLGRVQHVYFLAMNNVFEKGMPEEVYDLKGSTVNRTVLKPGESPRQGLVMKDNDFHRSLALMRPLNVMLVSQLEADSKWLNEHGIMDYSLLLGVHPLDMDDSENVKAKEDTEPIIDDEDLDIGESIFTQHNGGVYSSFVNSEKMYYKYYVAIIDMLQQYDVNKKLERGIKLTMLGMKNHETGGISSLGPTDYQARFMQFAKNHISVGRKDLIELNKRKRQQREDI